MFIHKMEIKVDKEGQEAIKQLCDIALKTGGLQNMQGVQQIINSIKLIEKVEVEEVKKDGN